MTPKTSLADVSTATLERLRDALDTGRLKAPVTDAALVNEGFRQQAGVIHAALTGHGLQASLAIVDVALAERLRPTQPAPELVWTGPEGASSTSRDTAVVLCELFERARESVILAGYVFTNAKVVLEPLYRAMSTRGVTATFFVNIQQTETVLHDADAYVDAQLSGFITDNWLFGAPYPRIFFDVRALNPGPVRCILHAKCVVVDEAKALISSANFTKSGQERNIETGVLLHDHQFASHLARQWLGLIDAKRVREWLAR